MDIEIIKGNQSEMKNTLSEMKSVLDGKKRVDKKRGSNHRYRGWKSQGHSIRMAIKKKPKL